MPLKFGIRPYGAWQAQAYIDYRLVSDWKKIDLIFLDKHSMQNPILQREQH